MTKLQVGCILKNMFLIHQTYVFYKMERFYAWLIIEELFKLKSLILVSCVDSVKPLSHCSYLKYTQTVSNSFVLLLFAIPKHSYSRGRRVQPYIYIKQGLCSRSPGWDSCVSTGDPGLQTDSHFSTPVKQFILFLS